MRSSRHRMDEITQPCAPRHHCHCSAIAHRSMCMYSYAVCCVCMLCIAKLNIGMSKYSNSCSTFQLRTKPCRCRRHCLALMTSNQSGQEAQMRSGACGLCNRLVKNGVLATLWHVSTNVGFCTPCMMHQQCQSQHCEVQAWNRCQTAVIVQL